MSQRRTALTATGALIAGLGLIAPAVQAQDLTITGCTADIESKQLPDVQIRGFGEDASTEDLARMVEDNEVCVDETATLRERADFEAEAQASTGGGASTGGVTDAATGAADTAQDTATGAADTAQDTAEAATDTATDTAADTEVQAEAGTDVQTGTDTTAGADVQTDTATGAEATADAATGSAGTDVQTDTTAGADTQVDTTAAETQADAGTDVQVETTAGADTQTGTTTGTETQADASSGTDGSDPQVMTTTQADASAGTGAQAGTTAETDTPVAAAAEADANGREPAEVTETTVTEETARTSDEDLNPQQAEAGVEAEAAATASGDDSGLSNFEKFALGAAGIFALSQILDNGGEVVERAGDRIVVRRSDGQLIVLKDDNAVVRRPGSDVRTETFSDGSTRTIVTRPNGVQVITITAADGRILRRTRVLPDGRTVILFDDTETVEPVDVTELPEPSQEPEVVDLTDREALRNALQAETMTDLGRRFSLEQVRNYVEVRELVPEINVDSINFETDSAAIRQEEAEELFALGEAMREMIDRNPDELFLVEGHTDAVGSASYNLALSDRRAESVALALTEYFDVPPESLIVQGYGEAQLLVPTEGAERANRRATVRRITPLLR